MPEPLLLLLGLLAAGALILAPLARPQAAPIIDDEREAAALRHRVALEALRDVDADRRAGSLDDATYAEQLTEAETRAATTGSALEAASSQPPPTIALRSPSRAIGAAAAGVIGIALRAGSVLPATGLANPTVLNEQLAVAQEVEAARGESIRSLLDQVAADPRNSEALSDLADAYLAGSGGEDLVRAAVALRLLIDLEPRRADAYERIVTAYVRAGDYENGRAALDSYAELAAADPVELAFFGGLIALRGEDDPAAAVEAFDRFLELAPDDARAGMVRGLRDEASGAP